MRCRACDGDFRAYKRTVKDGNQEFRIEEDLCAQCRQSIFWPAPVNELGDPIDLLFDQVGKYGIDE